MDNKEIELKFIINKEIKNKIIKYLKTCAISGSNFRLIDTYYIPNFREFEINGETMECVRIRETSSKAILSYKKIHRESSPVYCDEFETEVSNKTETEKILFALGFKIQMTIDKLRETYYLNNFEISFDSVKNLGELMEIELKNNFVSIDEIYKFVKPYGLTNKNVTYEGIQTLMKKHNKNIK